MRRMLNAAIERGDLAAGVFTLWHLSTVHRALRGQGDSQASAAGESGVEWSAARQRHTSTHARTTQSRPRLNETAATAREKI